MKTKSQSLCVVLALLALCTLDSKLSNVFAQGTAFIYQGQLQIYGTPGNGLYDFQFSLSNAPSGGSQVGSPVTNLAVGVTNGLFTTTLDFGAVFTGNPTWLAISVSSNGTGSFIGLTPLQPLTPSPYSIMANGASNLLGTLPAAQISGTIGQAQLPSSLTFSGTVTASSFSGNGGGLSNLNASALAGTVPDAVMASSLAAGSNESNAVGSVIAGIQPFNSLATNSFWLPWKQTNYYSAGQTIITSNGFLFENALAGLSRFTPPSGGIAFTNGSNVWLPRSSAFITNQPIDIPGIYTTFGQPSTSPPPIFGTNYTMYFVYTNTIQGFTNKITGTNSFSLTGGAVFPHAVALGTWATFGAAPMTPGGVYGTYTNNGIIAGFTAQGMVSFYTDAPLLAIGPIATLGTFGNFGNLYVDNVLVFPETIDGPTSYGTNVNGCFIDVDFHGVRKPCKISFNWTQNSPFPGVMVDSQSHIWPVPQNFTMYVEGCSFEQGGGDMPDCYGNSWPARLGRLIGCENTIVGAVGGTGFTNTGGKTIYSLAGSNSIGDNYLGRMNLIISNNPGIITIVGGCGNDAVSGASNSIYAGNLFEFNIFASGLPYTQRYSMLALVCNGQGTNATTIIPMRNAMSNAVVDLRGHEHLVCGRRPGWIYGNSSVGCH